VPLKLALPNDDAGQDYIHLTPKFELHYTVRATPKLDCRFVGPTSLAPNEFFRLHVHFKNTGAVPLKAITLLETAADGRNSIRGTVPELDIGGLANLILELSAPLEPGIALWHFRLNGGPFAERPYLFTAEVQAPLQVDVIMPSELTVDDVEPFRLRLENPSTKAMLGVRVVLDVPIELKFDSSDGHYDTDADNVSWFLEELPPGDVRTYTAWLKANLPGDFRLDASAITPQGETHVQAHGICTLKPNATNSRPLSNMMAELDLLASDERLEIDVGRVATGTRTVVFHLGEGSFATRLEGLNEVIRQPTTSPVPDAPGWFLGLANVRGEVTSIVDLAGVLGLGSSSGVGSSVMVAHAADGTTVGFLVNGVVGIRRLTLTPWEESESGSRGDWGTVGAFITDLGPWHDQLVPVLDLNRLIVSDVLNVFQAVG